MRFPFELLKLYKHLCEEKKEYVLSQADTPGGNQYKGQMWLRPSKPKADLTLYPNSVLFLKEAG